MCVYVCFDCACPVYLEPDVSLSVASIPEPQPDEKSDPASKSYHYIDEKEKDDTGKMPLYKDSNKEGDP